MSDNPQEPPDLELVKIQAELMSLTQRFVELSAKLPHSKYHSTVQYFLGQAQGAITNLSLQLLRSKSRKQPRV